MDGTVGTGTVNRWYLTYEGRVFILIGLLTLARFAIAPLIPLAYDEAYYWRWAQYPALGYFDHPPLIAWITALGTAIAGDTLTGVRLVSLVASVPATWAVWRAAEVLFGDRRLAATAALFFNLTLIVAVGTILATPDAPLLIAAAFVLYFLARAAETRAPVWWLAAGVAVGIGCLAKFTAFFWLPGILLWLLVVPSLRGELRRPWPWLGALAAALVYLPNLIWNAQHEWMTFGKQLGRVNDGGFSLQYLNEHLGMQLGMATPAIFVLGWMALAVFLVRGEPREGRVLLGVLVWPMTIYFLTHALHARVEGNWMGPVYPAFAIAAAAACHLIQWRGFARQLADIARVLAVPIGLLFVAVIYLQALTGFVPLGAWDPTAQNIGAGMPQVAAEVDAVRVAQGATGVVTMNYGMTGWLSFYLPSHAPVIELNEAERSIQEPPPDPAVLRGPLLAVLPQGDAVAPVEAVFGAATAVGTVTRTRGDMVVARYDLYRLAGTPAQLAP